jgi:hypothetical protein
VNKPKDPIKELLVIAKDFLRLVSGELDQYTSEKGIIEMGKSEVTLFAVSHIQFAKYGRGPGKKPPFQNILDFVKKERIKFEGTDERGTAFAIQASIGKKGTKNYVKNAPNALEEAIELNYNTLNEKMSKQLMVFYQKQIGETLEAIKIDSRFKI